MRRAYVKMLCALGLAGVTTGAIGRASNGTTGWQPPAGLKQLPIWPERAPDMAGVSDIPETVEIEPKSIGGLATTLVHNVTDPTITIYPAKGINTRAAMIVFPGGGFKVLAMDLEGTEICDWATSKGMVCVLLKYRVPDSDTYGDPATGKQIVPKALRALQDAQRAIRLTRARANQLKIDPHKIGVIGFSAGGYLVAQTSNIFESAYRPIDAVDHMSSRPDFAIAAYPGHLCRAGEKFDPTVNVNKNTPPTFIVQDFDDRTDDICNSTMYAHRIAMAGIPAEVHLFAKGDHAFALRHVGHPVEMWPSLVEKWLREMGIL